MAEALRLHLGQQRAGLGVEPRESVVSEQIHTETPPVTTKPIRVYANEAPQYVSIFVLPLVPLARLAMACPVLVGPLEWALDKMGTIQASDHNPF